MHHLTIFTIIFVACLQPATIPAAERTDGWRGPFTNGFYPAHNLPAQIDMQTNLKWATPMPGLSIAEPPIKHPNHSPYQ